MLCNDEDCRRTRRALEREQALRKSYSDQIDALRASMRQMRWDIEANADDTYWIGPAETVVDRINNVLGEGQDG